MQPFLQNNIENITFPVNKNVSRAYIKHFSTAHKRLFYACIILAPFTYLLSLLGAYWLLYKQSNKPIVEQKRYYQDNGLTWLPLEKRLALQLQAPIVYADKLWTETLELQPCVRRYTDNNKPVPTTFQYIALVDTEFALKQLDQYWGFVSKQGYLDTIKALFAGKRSKALAYQLQYNPEKLKMVERLSALTGLSEDYILSRNQSQNAKPPLLVWGFDLWQVFHLTRTSYMAGIISEHEAWENILKAANWIHYLFDNIEDFYDGYRLGNAFAYNDFTMATTRKKWLENYKINCDWPIKQLAWPQGVIADLPDYVKNGFAKEINAIYLQQNPVAASNFVGEELMAEEHTNPRLLH